MKKWTFCLVLATVVVYMTLSVSAATCLFTHQAQPRSTHHHSSGAPHSLLCAWACQANQPVDGPSAAPDSHPLILAALILFVVSLRPSLFFLHLAQSRAPPRF
jgi:hypothetical protein